MSDEGEHVVVEQQSNAGKWILILLAIIAASYLAVAGKDFPCQIRGE